MEWENPEHGEFDRKIKLGLLAEKKHIARVRPEADSSHDTGEEFTDLREALESMLEHPHGAIVVNVQWFGEGKEGWSSILHTVEMMPDASIEERIASINRQAALKIGGVLAGHYGNEHSD